MPLMDIKRAAISAVVGMSISAMAGAAFAAETSTPSASANTSPQSVQSFQLAMLDDRDRGDRRGERQRSKPRAERSGERRGDGRRGDRGGDRSGRHGDRNRDRRGDNDRRRDRRYDHRRDERRSDHRRDERRYDHRRDDHRRYDRRRDRGYGGHGYHRSARYYGHGAGPRHGHGYFCSLHNIFHYYDGYDPIGWFVVSFGYELFRAGYIGDCEVVSQSRRRGRYTEVALLCYDDYGYPYIKAGSRRTYANY